MGSSPSLKKFGRHPPPPPPSQLAREDSRLLSLPARRLYLQANLPLSLLEKEKPHLHYAPSPIPSFWAPLDPPPRNIKTYYTTFRRITSITCDFFNLERVTCLLQCRKNVMLTQFQRINDITACRRLKQATFTLRNRYPYSCGYHPRTWYSVWRHWCCRVKCVCMSVPELSHSNMRNISTEKIFIKE